MVRINPGASYFVTSKIALNAELGGLGFSKVPKQNGNPGGWSFNTNFSISSFQFGATVFF